MTERRVDAVFEGGGVKGIGLVGAVAATEARGFVFENVAGTSAGAIVAALVAAGYSAAELEREMKAVDYRKFRDKDLLDRIPVLGPALSLGFERGIYEGAYFERWLDGLLAEKGKRTFGDLVMPEYADDPRFRYKLQVIAADISRGKLLVLPRDIGDYGLEPDELGIARAVRMSIPFFFEPVKLAESCIVDGGVLSFARTIPIPTLGVRTTDFDITDAQRDALFDSGREAAEHFLAKWDFERYKARYRKAEPPPRSERLF